MRNLLKPLLIVLLVLVLPVLPLIVWGEMFTGWVDTWRQNPPGQVLMAAGVMTVLAADIFLPVPSGPVMTLAGAQLGAPLATAVGWLGTTVGALLGYGAAWRWGWPLALRLAKRNELRLIRRSGHASLPWLLLVTRPLPILAEATVLLAGIVRLPPGKALPPMFAGNLLLAIVFAALGQTAADREWLVPALFASALLPICLALLGRNWLARKPASGPTPDRSVSPIPPK